MSATQSAGGVVVVVLSDDEEAEPHVSVPASASALRASASAGLARPSADRLPIEVPLDDSTDDDEASEAAAADGVVGVVDVTPRALPHMEPSGGSVGGGGGGGGGRARSHSAGGEEAAERGVAAAAMMGRPAEDHGAPVGTRGTLRQRTTSFSDERVRFSRREPGAGAGAGAAGGGALATVEDSPAVPGGGGGGGGDGGMHIPMRGGGGGGAGGAPAGTVTPEGAVGVSVVPGSQADKAVRRDLKKKGHVLRKPAALKRLQRGREAVEKRQREKMAGKVIDRQHALYQLSFGMMLGIFCSVVHGARRLGKLSLDDFMAVEKLVFPPKGSKMTPAHSMPNAFKFKASSRVSRVRWCALCGGWDCCRLRCRGGWARAQQGCCGAFLTSLGPRGRRTTRRAYSTICASASISSNRTTWPRWGARTSTSSSRQTRSRGSSSSTRTTASS